MPIFIWVDILALNVLNLLCIIANFLTIGLHRRGWLVLALLLKLFFVFVLVVVAGMLLGNDVGFEYYFFIFLLEIVISDLQQRYKIILSGLLLGAFLIMLQWLFGLWGSWPLGDLARRMLLAFNLMTTFVLITFIALQVYIVSEVTERRFRSDAYKDSLTGVFNRRAIIERADMLWRQQRPFAVLLLDADHFKQVNDSYGHGAGDKVLHHIAQLLQRALRERDCIGRVGGEEFLILLPDTNFEEGVGIAARLRAELASQPCRLDKRILQVTLSMGLAWSYEKRALNDVIDLADRRLYLAKFSGRDLVIAEGGESFGITARYEMYVSPSSTGEA
ncbi:GGDEF domain-containing protein [Halomonas sp. M20]|uniref:GGDEF domain-containing protein n=1 Tax=Halomonas sp. M20 TaxID=2763264 RepID=UPI001D0A9618|nr:GGDEF domain-containing protein [Halomonas sp. M20]